MKKKGNLPPSSEGTIDPRYALKQVEQALQEEKERFRLAAESLSDIVYEWDLGQNIKWFGDIDGLLGFAPGEFPRTLDAWANRLHPDDRERVWAGIQSTLRGEARYDLEYRIQHKSGGYRLWAARGALRKDGTGQPAGWVGAVTDITLQKDTENRLARQGAILDAVFTALQETVALLDPMGVILNINPDGAKRFGMTPEEMVGKNIYDLLPEPLSSERKKIITRVMETRQPVHFQDQRKTMDFVNGVYPIDDPQLGGLLGAVVFAADITQLKQTEKYLRESEERFRVIFERSTIGKSLTLPDGRLMKINKAFADMFGYTVEEVQNLNFAQLTVQDDIPESREVIRSLLASEHDTVRFEKRYIHKNGSVVWADVSTTLLRDPNGAPLHLITSVVDITERIKVEGKLKKLNRMYAVLSDINQAIVRTRELNALFDQICDIAVKTGGFRMVWIGQVAPTDPGRSIQVLSHSGGSEVYFDQAAATLLDCAPATCAIQCVMRDQRHATCKANLNPPVPDSCQEAARQLGCNSAAAFPIINRGSLWGTISFYAGEADFFDEDEILLLDELAMDVSFAIEFAESEAVRRAAQEALIASEKKWQLLATSTPDFVSLLDSNDRFLFLNHYAEGFGEDQVVGRSVFDFVAPESVELFRQAILRCKETGEIFKFEHKALGDHAEWRYYEDYAIPLLDQDQVRNTIVVSRDITQRKQAEFEVLKLNADLEQRVRDRTAQLEAANKELEAFASSVSHDLRAPLRGIDGWSQILLEENNDQLNETGREGLAFIRSETKRMGVLIEALLQLSRISRTDMQFDDVDLSALAHSIVRRLQNDQPRPSVQVIVQAGLAARGDSALIEIALTNLLDNAWKFTGNRPDGRIEFGQTESHGQPAFFVRDNGAGFDMAYASKLFGVFQRMHRLTEFPGTGIGLAIVRRIVHRHNGEIWAEAQANRGATFFFTFGELA